jgi:DNA polymerase III delta prime subunit
MDNLIVNKYKPKNISEFIYNNNIKKIIYDLISINELSIILHGDKGCGKTTLLNCIVNEYYNNHPNYIENILNINNISEQGINYYRNDVKLFCQTNSTIAKKKKIILLDNFDQISEQSQQVFRNYIDKYHNKVAFIITTSNLHKIINSIQSRFLVLNLTKPNKDEVTDLCLKIIKNENIHISIDNIKTIIQLTDNTIYYIFNYLEKIKLFNSEINEEIFNKLLTHINNNIFDNYFNLIKQKSFHEAVTILLNLHNDGFSVVDILDSLFLYIKHCSILSESEKYKIVPILCKYITIFYDIHEHYIELIFITNNLLDIF